MNDHNNPGQPADPFTNTKVIRECLYGPDGVRVNEEKYGDIPDQAWEEFDKRYRKYIEQRIEVCLHICMGRGNRGSLGMLEYYRTQILSEFYEFFLKKYKLDERKGTGGLRKWINRVVYFLALRALERKRKGNLDIADVPETAALPDRDTAECREIYQRICEIREREIEAFLANPRFCEAKRNCYAIVFQELGIGDLTCLVALGEIGPTASILNLANSFPPECGLTHKMIEHARTAVLLRVRDRIVQEMPYLFPEQMDDSFED
ncbi:MAG: hypothetical protein ACRC8S_04940 [Fimbriiglobus sp.]